MYYVYVMQSQSDGKLYKGYTADVEKRVRVHNQGKVRSTRKRRPFILIYKEEYETKSEAIKREKFLKSLEGGKVLKSILHHTPR